MLACSFDISLSNVLGLVCAFGSTIIFVSQNIFFKKVMPSPGNSSPAGDSGMRLDKVNLLYFSSGMAFLLMIPIWAYTDGMRLASMWLSGISPATANSTASVSTVLLYFFINGTVHFFQNVLAFAILSSTSPVTYSIASLVKRIAVICLAIVWFKQAVHGVQAVGIMLTAVGLWMYNNAKRDVDKGEKRFRQVEAAREAARDGVLPVTLTQARLIDGSSNGNGNGNVNVNVAYLEKAKSSPRPQPLSNDSVYSAATSGMRAQPGMYAPPPRKHVQVPVNAEPYPSPPASAASSPPFAPERLTDEPYSPVTLAAA
jgi:solute carrier family 35 protein E1